MYKLFKLPILRDLKFILSKANVYLRYNKNNFKSALKFIFFGKEISNFSYEISNQVEFLHCLKNICNHFLTKKFHNYVLTQGLDFQFVKF